MGNPLDIFSRTETIRTIKREKRWPKTDSSEIFNKYLAKEKYSLSEFNNGFKNENSFGVFINPILNKLLELAFDDPKKYQKKIIAILDYGIENNHDVIVRIQYVISS